MAQNPSFGKNSLRNSRCFQFGPSPAWNNGVGGAWDLYWNQPPGVNQDNATTRFNTPEAIFHYIFRPTD